MAPKVLHLSTYDANGGAARAAYALHRAMLGKSVPSRMHVAVKGTADATVTHGDRSRHLLAQQLDRGLWRLQRSPRTPWRSPARFGSLTADAINRSSADVVNLHWVTDGFLSVETIGRIDKPIVWSMYDMWPFTGTEHYDAIPERWQGGYTAANRPVDESGVDLDRWTFNRKERCWTGGPVLRMVPASSWLAEATRTSALLGSQPVVRIPHVVDTDVFAPLGKAAARQALGLPDWPTVLFVASAGITDHRKGGDLLEQAMASVGASHPSVRLVVVGPAPDEAERAAIEVRVSVPVHWHGAVSDAAELRSLYAAADVVAVPSREDNMPLTAMEAHSVGRPVVAFRIGGLPDIVAHEITGYLAKPLDVTDLAEGLAHLLDRAVGGEDLDRAARQHALDTWSPDVVVPQYLALYEDALG